MDYIYAIEKALGKEAKKNFLPVQQGEVLETSSSSQGLENWIGFKPETSVLVGVENFVEWYLSYYKVQPTK